MNGKKRLRKATEKEMEQNVQLKRVKISHTEQVQTSGWKLKDEDVP